ncbi:MAG TPA: glycosyltransferase, partial [Terriglobales bacterium]|nr:glycosyltransferase [Terriglobales bacterium]
MARRIAILGGGTAGHVYPALAIAEAYRQHRRDVEILFIGSARGYENQLVPAAGYRLECVPTARWLRTGLLGKARAVVVTSAGLAAAARLLRQARTELVIGFGGYASAGALLAARLLRLPIVLHEPNAKPGLTNRAFARFADRVHIHFPEAAQHFRASATVLTGTPIRREIVAVGERVRRPAEGTTRVLVSGGSLGDDFLNR